MEIDTYVDYEAVLATRREPVHLALRFRAAELQTGRDRPIAFCLVMDRSGSMAGTPLAGAKEAARQVVRNLRYDDLLSIVVFDESAHAVLPLQPVHDAHRVLRMIDGIEAGSSTNLAAGWMRGRDELEEAPRDVPRRLLLLSDGQLNTGITEPAHVSQLCVAGLERSRVRTSCLGFGDGYDEELLSMLAVATGGELYDATSPEELPRIFAAELEGLQRLSVQNLRVRYRHLMFCEGTHLLSDYPAHELMDGRVEIEVGDLISREERRLILALDVLAMPLGADHAPVASLEGEDLLELEVLWEALSDTGVTKKAWQRVVKIRRVQNPEEVSVNEEVIPWVAEQQAGRSVRSALDAAGKGETGEARRRLELAREKIGKLPEGRATQLQLRLIEETLEELADNEELGERARKELNGTAFCSMRPSSRRESRDGGENPEDVETEER